MPLDEQASACIARLKRGTGVTVTITEYNNPDFHAKLMALFQLGFDAYEPTGPRYLGYVVRKEFKQFRKDITILAGYYERYTDKDGRTWLNARSLSFDSMEPHEREDLFSAVLDVILARVLTNYTRADLEAVIAKTLGFAR